MKDYSQSGEQKIILDYFGDRKGTVLSIGENDGETFSMSRALMLGGWKGVLVEPSPQAFRKLAQLYRPVLSIVDGKSIAVFREPMPILMPAAITTTDGPIDLYDSGTHLKKGDVALLSTTVPKEMDRWKKSGEQFTKTSVRGITFATLMKETACSHFDFISIDCEGADWSVLKQIELREVGCKMLCIEYNAKKTDEITFTAYCQTFGLKLIHKTYENLIFAR